MIINDKPIINNNYLSQHKDLKTDLKQSVVTSEEKDVNLEHRSEDENNKNLKLVSEKKKKENQKEEKKSKQFSDDTITGKVFKKLLNLI